MTNHGIHEESGIDEDAKQVYIMNVIYNRRDQLRQLANMKLDL